MLRKNRRHLISADGAVVPCDRVRPEEHVQYLIEAAFVADDAQPSDVAVEPVLCAGNASFRGCIGIFVFVYGTHVTAAGTMRRVER